MEVQPDGLEFDPASVRTESTGKGREYEGLRIRFLGVLGTARVHIQIDMGFGDVVYPKPVVADLPAMLDFPAARMLCYSRESTIAEKLEAMVKLGRLNSRMKDFYDIWLLSRQYEFSGAELSEAIKRTFERRDTVLRPVVETFAKPFVDEKQTQWSAFRDRLQQDHIPASFADITDSIIEFLSPAIAAVTTGDSGPTHWAASGPWS